MSVCLTALSAFQDNYIWILNDTYKHCLIIDPGEGKSVLDTIIANQWIPEAILLTHHHHDHVGGVKMLLQHFTGLKVYGPEETRSSGANHIVTEGERFTALQLTFQVIATPGHTLGHVSYYSAPYLFCGDTLFSGGCGRLFEGTARQMHDSLQRLNQLPAETLVCCAHEYTESNLAFACHLLPDDKEIVSYLHKIRGLRDKNQPTVPSTLQKERKINIFLKIKHIDLHHIISNKINFLDEYQIFADLRQRKDRFK